MKCQKNKMDKAEEGHDKINIVSLFTLVSAILILAGTLQDFDKAHTEMQLVRQSLNVTGLADDSYIVFNRNPKAGSETLWSLMDRLSKLNNFTSYSDSAEVKNMRGSENTFMWRTSERHEYIQMLNSVEAANMTRPFSYVKHFSFLDMRELNYSNPIYINMVRHPVDRVISWYYYIRQPTYLLRMDPNSNKTIINERRSSIRELKMTYEQCVLSRDPECTYLPGNRIYFQNLGGSHYSQIAFFCGHSPECNVFESDRTLSIAKENVEKYYSVVGVLEQWEQTLHVLEEFVPKYFRNSRKVYSNMMKSRVVNRNPFKPKTPDYIRDMIMANFTKEIDFFHFCKQRLRKQYLSIL